MVFPAQHSGQSLRLPSPPTVLSRLLKMLAEDRSSAVELAEVILEDPGLTARILRVANSSFYNFSNKIETVSHAIALLGCQSIRILCASESFLAIFPQRKGNFTSLFKNYCQHSLVTALLAKILAEELGVAIESEKVFIAGLLHDIGKPVLWYNFLEKSSLYHDLRSRDLSEREAERLAYGVDHTEAGAWVAGEWGLDSEFAKTMAYHHENKACCAGTAARTLADHSMAELVGLANILSKCFEPKAGKLIFGVMVEKITLTRLSGFDWQRVAYLFAEQAPLYGLDQVSEQLTGGRSQAVKPESVIDNKDSDSGHEELVQRSFALFKAYSSFLDNFKLTDVFAGILENLINISGVSASFIMLYKSREQSLTVRNAAGKGASLRLGKRLLLDASDLENLKGRENPICSFSNDPQEINGNSLVRKLATLFLDPQKSEQGLLLPVYSECRLIGAFALKLETAGAEDDLIFKELLLGHAVQLALAVRFYQLSQKIQVLGAAETSISSALVLGHALKVPLTTLRENIYMLDQDGRNARSSRTGYSHIYSQKIKHALEDINASISRYTSPSKEATG